MQTDQTFFPSVCVCFCVFYLVKEKKCLLNFLYNQDDEARKERMEILEQVYSTASRVPKNPTFMAGYPAYVIFWLFNDSIDI